MQRKLATLASKMMLTPRQAICLPATIEVAAEKCGRTQDEIVAIAMNAAEVRQYLANACRKTAAIVLR